MIRSLAGFLFYGTMSFTNKLRTKNLWGGSMDTEQFDGIDKLADVMDGK